LVWDHLKELWHVRSFLDIGCGVGASLSWWHPRGIECHGIEGDPTAVAAASADIRHLIRPHDYVTGPSLRPTESYDLGWSIEFLEHVEERFLPHILADMRQCAHIVVTASPSADGGHHHVNCKPRDWWLHVMSGVGMEYMQLTTELAHVIGHRELEGSDPNGWFVARSSMVFRRTG
jgi:2-polyprenyl-3-methyl-5-hydroxy-6-metoxy-1,4-benzoquinol methylase